MFWLEKNLILSNVLISGESNFDEKTVEEMFNWSKFHSEKKYVLLIKSILSQKNNQEFQEKKTRCLLNVFGIHSEFFKNSISVCFSENIMTEVSYT